MPRLGDPEPNPWLRMDLTNPAHWPEGLEFGLQEVPSKDEGYRCYAVYQRAPEERLLGWVKAHRKYRRSGKRHLWLNTDFRYLTAGEPPMTAWSEERTPPCTRTQAIADLIEKVLIRKR